MSSRAIYRQLCEKEPSIALFQQAWWLDATCGESGWDVALVQKGGEVHAALPFQAVKRRGFTMIVQPRLTQFLGPWIRSSGATKAAEYGRQKELLTALIDALPIHDRYVQNWNPNVGNWLPFYWKGFNQSTNYTYVLKDLADIEKLWAGLQGSVRTDIRRAQNRVGIAVEANGSLEDFLNLNRLTFERQDKSQPYSTAFVGKIDTACSTRDCRRIFIARDASGRAHSGIYLVWDANSAYYLMGGGDPELRSSGATSLCMWEAIRFAAGVTRSFDFEGSMIEPIERFFRAFGAVQTPYFRLSRTTSPLLRAVDAWRLLRGRR
ncbi:GNAT family N-acetyltransferase [Mesorhizobium sp. SP-1A]|uniref:GNAT family N-acetyltransferase n=1 Tax=Mesorhizobium sp. SP-1A TaxID=3077840 RepID=UPI0028F6FB49|nr:GNAT family N-acetyltransferase [Mesorhizobium sp. SP-1A]